MPRIYYPASLAIDSVYNLDADNAAHLIRVLRLTDGDQIEVFNGIGDEYAATLCDVQKKSAAFKIQQLIRQEEKPALTINLGQVVSKGDRMDFTIQKATELGASEITPLWSERCEVRLKGERLEKKMQHWQNIAISACQQSGRCWVPTINPPQDFMDWAKHNKDDVRLLMHPHQQQPLSQYAQPHSVALLIGPEGGFSEDEVTQAIDAGFTGLCLGPRILRTETASLAAISVLQYAWGDFNS